MSTPDLEPILDDLAAGRIDADEANRRIEALTKPSAAEPDGGDGTAEVGPDSAQETYRPGGLERVSITAIGRRVRIVADPSIATVKVEGNHVLRRTGSVMEVSSTSEFGPSLKGFSVIRPPKNLGDLKDIGLGKELLVTVNPALLVDAELTTGSLRTEGVARFGRVRVTGGSTTLTGLREVSDLLSQAGGVTLIGPISSGRSKVRIESGNLTIRLQPGANVVIRAESKLGHINWPGDSDHVDEYTVGNGSARLDVNVVMGIATIKLQEQE